MCPTVAYTPSPEYVSDAWDQYLYVPTVVDPSPAPEGKHSATIFTPYFPAGLDADDNRDRRRSGH